MISEQYLQYIEELLKRIEARVQKLEDKLNYPEIYKE